MHPQSLSFSFSKTLNPNLIPFPFHPLLPASHKPIKLKLHCQIIPKLPAQNATHRLDFRTFAGRSKGKSGGSIDGGADLLRESKRNARRRSKKMAESLFYRLKNPHKNYPDNFSEEELQMIGLGYDRLVRFMDKDDPNLKHPYDWYKYGEFGPYSWRGIVLGDPIRGDFSDERVTMIGEVRDQEEWEKIEQHDMAREFQRRLDAMDKGRKKRYFWVFVRHPKWRVSDLPWQQWTLVCEVALEAGDQRLDKWTLMGRLGNKARAMITQCAAWMRPDIIYVKRPVYQCRFEPQDDFFQPLVPLLDPETEKDYMCELVRDDGSVEMCTYFGGLCKIVRISPKAFVDDVTNAYEKLSDDDKSKCLEFLLGNHPMLLLHPYTKEWKAKLEEMELGCDAPDDDDDGRKKVGGDFIDWVEDEGNDEERNVDDDDEEEDPDDVILDVKDAGDEVLGIQEYEPEEDDKYWEEEFKKALRSNEAMEKLVEKSIDATEKYYEDMGIQKKEREEGDELEMRGKRAKVSQEEWKRLGYGPYRKKVKKSRVPPGLFLRAAVRPFTYRNLVKEIVLTRHAILEGEVGREK
ncbi:uncharacterized protein LOC121755292 [Salvia splendens]|uniref:uncharacterized protein LOC121755292 n=1 Tax=Salvia splendens TaxID=180675 RepID=UPI001C27CF5A|nr:uncharacterized protein LOC121755292 [Salvia splendens]